MTTPAHSGLFISLEGIDGAGKSSHLACLAHMFRNREVVQTREPGGTPLAEQLRALLLHEPMDAMTEALLAFAARRDHVRRVIAPALARGAVVLCDRFTDSSFAYQGGGHGLPWETLQQLERMVQGNSRASGLTEPHLTLWFDLAPELAAQRLAAAARVGDRFECEGADFFARVAAAYAQRAAAATQRFVRIAADLPLQETRAHIRQALVQRGWLART